MTLNYYYICRSSTMHYLEFLPEFFIYVHYMSLTNYKLVEVSMVQPIDFNSISILF